MKRLLASILLMTAPAWAQEIRPAIPVDGPSDDLARYLAGLPVQEGSPLAVLQEEPAYRHHAAEFGKMWGKYLENYFAPIRSWTSAEVATRVSQNLPIYYFFGGPDAINALAYFPNAPVYILGGLEPVGAITAPQVLDPAARAFALDNLRKSTEVNLNYGHFITKDMKTDLDKAEFRGVIPVLNAFVAMSGGKVLSTGYVGISSDGVLHDFGNQYKETKGMLPGAKIVFQRAIGMPAQTMYYIQANVADDALKGNGAFLKWAGGFGQGVVYLKAASYLMYESYFSRVREFLLSHAVAVLQDDSGIPFRYFRNENWRCYFFGSYAGTLDIFKQHFQGDLHAAFGTPGAAFPLPFGTGYKWRHGESNLMLAIRQQAPRAEAVNGTAAGGTPGR